MKRLCNLTAVGGAFSGMTESLSKVFDVSVDSLSSEEVYNLSFWDSVIVLFITKAMNGNMQI